MKAKVVVMPKAAVLDPQGAAVREAMQHLGMREVKNVRIGKYLEIDLEHDGAATQIIAVGKTARQNNGVKTRQRSRFMPDIFRL